MNDGKTNAIISYLTIIGWVIALILRQNENPKSSISLMHLRQSLGIFIVGTLGYWILGMLGIYFLISIWGVLVLIAWVIGLVNAAQGEEKPLPYIGQYFQDILSFIQ